jgi:hypothetical protein
MTDAVQTKTRKHPRCKLPGGIFVAWQAGGRREVSRLTTVGLGGLFIQTTSPVAVGANLRLIFDAPGGEIRARAIVRNTLPGEGMGIQFVELRPECRARLSELIRIHLS